MVANSVWGSRMEDLASLLSDHRITGASSFSRAMGIMGRLHLRSFLSDLVQFGASRGGVSPRGPGQLRVAPAGGYLGLGTATEVIRELLLYADHIVLDNQLASTADALLKRQGKFQEVRRQVLVELYPLIFQFFAIEPAWREKLISFGYSVETPHNPKHRLASHVKPALRRNLKYVPPEAKLRPWVQLQVGPRVYVADTAMRMMNPSLYRMDPPYPETTRELNKLAGSAWQAMGPGNVPRREGDPQEVLSPDHELASALDEFVSFEIEYVERLSRLCLDHSAQLVTDSPAEWSVLQALAGHDERASPIADQDSSTFVFQLAREIPFLSDIPLPALIELRSQFGDEFDYFRGQLLRLGGAHTKGDPEAWRAEAMALLDEEIRPSLAALSKRVRVATETGTVRAFGSMAAAVLTGLIAWVGHSALPLLAAIPVLQTVLQSADKYAESQDDPMYFLLQVRHEAEQQR
jgi:hypothetical protein